MSRVILITGGAGNVGGSLACRLVENDMNHVVIVDNLSTGSLDKLPDRRYRNWHFIKADVNNNSDVTQIMTSHRFDLVFHYAAIVGVQRTLQQPVAVLSDMDGIRNVLTAAKNTGVKRVFFSSSSEVYGEPVELPQHEETTPLNSRLPYAIIKNLGESYCRSFYQEFGLRYNIFRFFNTYGPKQTADFVVPKFIEAALKDEAIPVYGDGSQTRTFCYIDDNIDTVLAVAEHENLTNTVINIGSDIELPIRDLAHEIIAQTRSKSTIKFLPRLPEGDMTRRKPDTTLMRSILNRPLTAMNTGLSKTIEAVRVHLQKET